MRILVAGATGSIGLHVVNTAIKMGHRPVALIRNKRKVKSLPRGTDIFYGDVSLPETLTELPKDIDAIIFTLGSDGQGRIGARAIDYGGIAQVLVSALTHDEAKNKTFELVAERGEAQQDLNPLFADLQADDPQKNDGVLDIDNMPLREEPDCIINELNLYSKKLTNRQP
ncbi:NAD-dependent epimerase/dehydratase family protein [Citrobacter freundii]|uniref:NAD(P)H-binding protein n=1 Tax=Citrobacter freundii TaxID=546 RepID=UPI000FD6CE66|nr:NAD(P)H-binding protein [Citrobacter freundii]RVR57748.1 NAD-dependent epimerase/dehydratase family protein [Citrobacter freundii]